MAFLKWSCVPTAPGAAASSSGPAVEASVPVQNNPLQYLAVALIILLIWEMANIRGMVLAALGMEPMVVSYGRDVQWDLGRQRATTSKSVPAGVSDVIQVSPI